jgi:guanylate kinase
MVKTDIARGKLVIISGPSGVGKGTICAEVAKRLGNVLISVSVTTRPQGKDEVDGREYWFVSPQEFQRRIDEDLFLEYAEVFGYLYGTSKDEVENALSSGKTIILEIDVQGGKKVKMIYPQAVMIFILPPDQKELARRLGGRGRDEIEVAEKRLDEAGAEIASAFQYYEHMVINDDLNQAVSEVINIIEQTIGEQV